MPIRSWKWTMSSHQSGWLKVFFIYFLAYLNPFLVVTKDKGLCGGICSGKKSFGLEKIKFWKKK